MKAPLINCLTVEQGVYPFHLFAFRSDFVPISVFTIFVLDHSFMCTLKCSKIHKITLSCVILSFYVNFGPNQGVNTIINDLQRVFGDLNIKSKISYNYNCYYTDMSACKHRF